MNPALEQLHYSRISFLFLAVDRYDAKGSIRRAPLQPALGVIEIAAMVIIRPAPDDSSLDFRIYNGLPYAS